MPKALELTGQKFGRLTVVQRVENDKKGAACWLCKCDCGNEKVVQASQLKSGMTKSCGCLLREVSGARFFVHGLKHTRLYDVWSSIKARCFNLKNEHYKDYGGRGIKMCDEWKNDFKVFYNWSIANGYNETAKKYECTIDRIDNNKDYAPDNCRWVTQKEQCNNKRNNHLITYNNETHTVMQWAEIIGIEYRILLNRINKYGWSIERAFITPVRKRKK